MGIGGEALAAVLLGDDHAQEALVADVLPHRQRHVLLLGALPVVGEAAQFIDFVIEKSLLLFTQLRPGVLPELVPVRITSEQLSLPPHRAGLDRVLFGLRHTRQRLAEGLEDGRRHPLPAPAFDQKQTHRSGIEREHEKGQQH